MVRSSSGGPEAKDQRNLLGALYSKHNGPNITELKRAGTPGLVDGIALRKYSGAIRAVNGSPCIMLYKIYPIRSATAFIHPSFRLPAEKRDEDVCDLDFGFSGDSG